MELLIFDLLILFDIGHYKRPKNVSEIAINNNIDIAMSVKADGIQTGKNGEEIKYIRSRIGSQMIIGYSSHSIFLTLRLLKFSNPNDFLFILYNVLID